MRLFFALETPPDLRAALSGLLQRLRARSSGVRWVRPDGVHLTLRFLGEIEPLRLEPLVAAARAGTLRCAALRLRTSALRTFPERGRPRVVWLGLHDENGALAALHAALESALENAGFGREERPFAPHLTLGRAREGGDARAALAGVSAPESMSFGAEEFVLMESRLEPAGARYEARARFPLAATAPRVAT